MSVTQIMSYFGFNPVRPIFSPENTPKKLTPDEKYRRALANFEAASSKFDSTLQDAMISAEALNKSSKQVVECLNCPMRSRGDSRCYPGKTGGVA